MALRLVQTQKGSSVSDDNSDGEEGSEPPLPRSTLQADHLSGRTLIPAVQRM